MDPQRLLDQFLGPDAGQKAAGAAQAAKGKLATSGLGGIAGGLAAGGLLGVLIGNKKAPKKMGKLALVLAMIGAANADGHIGPDEQRAIFDQVGQMPLDAEDKAFVFDALSSPPSLQDIANLAEGPEQAAELYLASRLAIDPDHPAEQAYLEALAGRLALPSELVAHLESQAAEVG